MSHSDASRQFESNTEWKGCRGDFTWNDSNEFEGAKENKDNSLG